MSANADRRPARGGGQTIEYAGGAIDVASVPRRDDIGGAR
jgi:hypothetical protein